MARKLGEWKATHRITFADGRVVDVCQMIIGSCMCSLEAWEEHNGKADYYRDDGGYICHANEARNAWVPIPSATIEELDW